MRKIVLSCCLLLCSLTGFSAQKIAVLDFNAKVRLSQEDVDGLSSVFNTYFTPSGYTMVERVNIDRIIDELKFQRGRLTDANAIKIGELSHASKVVIGDVNLIGGQYEIDVHVVDVKTGEIDAKDGTSWASGTSFRATMKSLAERIASKIAIRPASSSSSSVSSSSSPSTRGYVDLGLSVKWATCNVGAKRPENYGEYFTFDDLSSIAISGGRVPTDNEWREVRLNCDWKWVEENGTKGYKVTSPDTGNNIFLPAAGYYHDMLNEFFSQGKSGCYWSSTAKDSSRAWNVGFSADDNIYRIANNRGCCFSVRLVADF